MGKERTCRLEWESFGLTLPNFVSYICPVNDTIEEKSAHHNKFLVCAEFMIHYFDVE